MPSRRMVVASVIALISGTLAQAQSPISSGAGLVSPSVVATTIVQYPSSSAAHLQLLVLWRGAPGWMTKGGGGRQSSWGSGNPAEDLPIVMQVSYGAVALTLAFRAGGHTLKINDRDVWLGPEDNVVLVDHVDASNGPEIIETLHIDPDAVPLASQGPAARPIVPAREYIRRSPKLIEYLRCDVAAPDLNGAMQQVMMTMCEGYSR